MLRTVATDAAVGHGLFRAYTRGEREARFELVAIPLIHTGEHINRLLGVITAIEAPFWLGAEPFVRHEIVDINLHWPDGAPAFVHSAEIVPIGRKRGRPLERGLSDRHD
jgi:hypothetical protein